MRLTRLSVLFYFTFLGMELSYLYLLASLLSGPIYALILMLLLYPLALLLKLTLPRSAFPHRLRFTLEIVLVTLVILLVVGERLATSLAAGQADVLGIILRMGFCGLTWGLGHTVPHEEVKYSSIAFRLQIGVLAVLVFSQLVGSVPPVFLFFLLAPLALFLARWTSSFSRGATALRAPNLSHLLLAGASVMVPGTALILLLSPGVARSTVDWLGNISTKLQDWVDSQQKAAANMTSNFTFDFGCGMRPNDGQLMPPENGLMPPVTSMPPPSEGGAGISPVVIWIIAFVIFVAIVALIVFALRRQRAGRKARLVEPVRFQTRMVSLDVLRSLISLFPQLLKKLWLWLTSLFRRLKRHPKPTEETLISIRALYRNLLRWAARQGVARAPAQTPLEHLKLLEERFPQQQDVLKKITEAYLLARYSQKAVSREEFDSAKEAWQRAVAYHTHLRFRT
ncbi:MAG: DUF4129 domain-containing protein [Dehalococcoidia bacterium]